MAEGKLRVIRDDEKQRYELREGDDVLGFADFEPVGDNRLVFPHTEVDPKYKGRGLGSILVRDALADVARRGEVAVPECPFVVRYLQENEVPGLQVDWPDEADAAASAAPAEPA